LLIGSLAIRLALARTKLKETRFSPTDKEPDHLVKV
jgi:hypothetical protein